MASKPLSATGSIQLALLVANLAEPKWENEKKELARLNGAWNEAWEEKEKAKYLEKLRPFTGQIAQYLKDSFLGQKYNKVTQAAFPSVLKQIGQFGTLDQDNLLANESVIDAAFVQEVLAVAKEGKFKEEAAFALLGIEIAQKTGDLVPSILEEFSESFSMHLARHLGRVTWDDRVVDSLMKALDGGLYRVASTGLFAAEQQDGVGLLAACSLIEIGSEKALRELTRDMLTRDIPAPNETLIEKFLAKHAAILLPYLTEGLALDDERTQVRTLKALGASKDPSVTSAVTAKLRAVSSDIVVAAINALARCGDKAAIPALQELANHPDKKVQKSLKNALKILAKA